MSYPNCGKEKIKKKSWKRPEGKKHIPVEEEKWELHPTSCQKPCNQGESGVKYLRC